MRVRVVSEYGGSMRLGFGMRVWLVSWYGGV